MTNPTDTYSDTPLHDGDDVRDGRQLMNQTEDYKEPREYVPSAQQS